MTMGLSYDGSEHTEHTRERPPEPDPLAHCETVAGETVFFESHETRKFADRWIRSNATVRTQEVR